MAICRVIKVIYVYIYITDLSLESNKGTGGGADEFTFFFYHFLKFVPPEEQQKHPFFWKFPDSSLGDIEFLY